MLFRSRDSRSPALPQLTLDTSDKQAHQSEPVLRLPDESFSHDLSSNIPDAHSSLQPGQLMAPRPGFYKTKDMGILIKDNKVTNQMSALQTAQTPARKPVPPMHEPIARFDPQTGKPLSPYIAQQPSKNKIAAGLLGLFFGRWGIHKFYLGLNKQGATMLGVNLLGIITSFLALINMAMYAETNEQLALISLLFLILGLCCTATIRIIALIESILYFSYSPEKFFDRYEIKKIGWF